MASIRESLSESIDNLDDATDLDETPQEIITDDVDTSFDGEEQEAQDFAPSEEEEKSDGAEAGGDAVSAESKPSGEAPSEPKKATSGDSIKAPASWKPQDRELWSKVPRNLQESIMKREKEISDTLTQTKQARDTYQYVEKMGRQFAPLLENSGFKHPLEAASAALNTMNRLSGGNTQQKAQEVAKIIQQFGIDIETLDNALVEGSNQNRQKQDPQAARLEQMLEERLKPYQQMMTQQQQEQQRAQQAKMQQANQAVAQFAEKAEFLEDVRLDMADIMELAEKRGAPVTIQQAYDRACAAHPEIARVLEERKQNESITGNRNSLTAKRNAASSISGRQGGNGGRQTGMSLRDTIISAMDDQ